MSKPIDQSSFIISTNGFADGPAQALRDYLLTKKAKQLIVINHPLVAESNGSHVVSTYKQGRLVSEKKYRLINKPPLTFLFDLLVPLKLPICDGWFGFNNLAAWRGLRRQKKARVGQVFYWAVDFVPDRFGNGLLTRLYNQLDIAASTKTNARIELSAAALVSRPKYLGLTGVPLAPSQVVPMGAWLAQTPKVKSTAWSQPKIVYLGHLVERQGVANLIHALAVLNKTQPKLKAEIIGSGPLEEELKQLAANLKLNNIVFHGFVKDHRDVEKILASATIAVAPYVKDDKSFTQFADPGKLKAYLGAGLPIALTDVPPNAYDIQKAGAGVIVDDTPEAIAAGITRLLNKNDWQKAHKAALAYSRQFDWQTILANCLKRLGYE